jgi:hypothetical protein
MCDVTAFSATTVTSSKLRFVFTGWYSSDLYLPSAHLSKVQNGVYYSGIKVFDCLPPRIKSLSSDVRKFKPALKRFLLQGSFYTVQEFFDWNLLSNPGIFY